MYTVFLTLLYNDEYNDDIYNFLCELQQIELITMYDTYNEYHYYTIHTDKEIMDTIEKMLDLLLIKLPKLRYLLYSRGINDKPNTPYRRIHINKKGKKVITKNARKMISMR